MHKKMHNRERSAREGSCPQRRRTPSFSSSLLDSIYRSFDESKSDLDDDHHLGLYHRTTSKQSFFSYNNDFFSEKEGRERMDLRHAVMLEDWMEKRSLHTSQLLNSSSSSSESSSGGLFSSSETESTYKKQRSNSRPKSEKPQKNSNPDHRNSERQHKKGSSFARTKLRALKIYDELNQKVKQPISPGSRIASFLSAIFNSENVKKAKMCYVGAVEDVSFEHNKSKSPCFSSSASRSCMSKTPSSKGKSNNGVKRTVRFYPVSVILGEDSEQQCGHKCIYDSVRKSNVMVKDNAAEAAARGFMKGYKNSGKGNFGFRDFYDNGEEEEEEDDDDDDLSCSSSDLFELDHLIGAGRYQEELPVYETTNLETNNAIANGLCL